ncbi:MAG: hypothetical protein CMO33_09400 [Verrucomicrobia bacterium]|nr:hypothetical protein [Verrucomicrobiota bacterium]
MEDKTMMLFPQWKQAVQNFIDEGFRPGDVVTKEWLYENFGLEIPTPETTTQKYQQTQLIYLTMIENFKEMLLTDHKILLIAKRGVGYTYVEPEYQASVAEHQMHAELKKALDRSATRLQHTDIQALDDDQRKQHADAMARTAMLGSMMKKKRRSLRRNVELPEDT